MSLSAILTEAYNFFRNHIVQLASLTVPLLLLQVVIQLWLGSELAAQAEVEVPQFGAMHGAAMMALLLIFSLLISALTLYLEVRSRGHEVTPGMILKNSFTFVPPLLLAGVFSGLAILAPVMLFAVFGPFWVVGLAISFYLFARLAYVNFMVIVERLTPLEAIKNSFKFSSPIVLKTMAILMMYIPLSLVGGTVLSLAEFGGFPLQVIIDTVFAFLGLFVNVALFRLYMVNRSTDVSEDDTNSDHTEI
ncbi:MULTISPECIES: hypothetical protein [unclassified Shewanella]|uniref:hypothetical protein n=1 Tax=unclassified Shewanella TaxID=196818 RepID=UPI000C8613CA|nr:MULTISPECIES: hypothetical protein [unclassified Shewanella]MDO6618423.1 hypothetical protein [Shewanella sp. 6_MG-2023]MDO6640245.1 hypothetical protein [Shewanella sp. 5_MG-2023]MDO6679676.1 hypothetical protein [Shewanella sp. 4_MG-2023]MDO6774443.1 hypothetical protein [Shewanella sp. 3_MG-2023]PMG28913.1 hypothetical protein BCU94_03450 [Shewanella sp. 10N.286.52.C2]